MKIAVWDTYVQRADGLTMHFDILVDSSTTGTEQVYHYGNEYLKKKAVENDSLNSSQCNFCHIESTKDKVSEQIKEQGYTILEIENCSFLQTI
ncbi:MAG: DUF2024 family protein [Reichenbachiella sp.]